MAGSITVLDDMKAPSSVNSLGEIQPDAARERAGGARTRMKDSVYRSYLLNVLLIILALNYVDRAVLSLVLEQIKVDLALTDTQLGLLSGIAFALFYSVIGIPISRWADRGNRVVIIAVSAALWSVAAALCGVAGSFLQLLLIRIGAAVGEAGCTPPALSLIADYFARAERPRAVARYMMGGPLSVVVGYSFAGWLDQLYGWRTTFLLLGPPGVIVGAVAWFTLREPRVGQTSPLTSGPFVTTPSLVRPSGKEVCVTLWANLTFRHLLVSISLIWFFGYGISQWQPTFFIRSYGLKTAELGLWLTLIWAVGGTAGAYLGGEWASRYASSNERKQLRIMAALATGFGAISTGIYLSRNPYFAFGLMGVGAVGINMIYGPLFAIIQTLVPERMRAVSVAVIYLFANLVGMGVGPLAAGVLSDWLRPHLGDESLRYTLLALSPGYLWSAWHLWQASNSVTRDLEAVQVAHRRAVVNDAALSSS